MCANVLRRVGVSTHLRVGELGVLSIWRVVIRIQRDSVPGLLRLNETTMMSMVMTLIHPEVCVYTFVTVIMVHVLYTVLSVYSTVQ